MEGIRKCLVVSMVTVLAGLAFVGLAAPAAAAPSPQIRGGVCGATIESSGTAAVCSEGGSGTPQPLPCDIGCWKPCKRWHFHDDGTVHCHGGGKN